MAKYIGPKCRLSRREGADLMLKSRSRALADADHVVLLHLEGGDVHVAPVDLDRLVVDELAALGPGGAEAHPVDHVVEPRLEQLEQVLAG